MSLYKELKRRNVIRVGIAYLAVSWLLIQIAETLHYAIVFALHDLGRMEEFELQFAKQIKRAESDNQGAEGIARIYAWMGDNDKAFEWLDYMVASEGPDMIELIDTDYYKKIKSDPRWRALRDKHGYFDAPIENIEIDITLRPGVTVD